jgi:hypothetical protein
MDLRLSRKERASGDSLEAEVPHKARSSDKKSSYHGKKSRDNEGSDDHHKGKKKGNVDGDSFMLLDAFDDNETYSDTSDILVPMYVYDRQKDIKLPIVTLIDSGAKTANYISHKFAERLKATGCISCQECKKTMVACSVLIIIPILS